MKQIIKPITVIITAFLNILFSEALPVYHLHDGITLLAGTIVPGHDGITDLIIISLLVLIFIILFIIFITGLKNKKFFNFINEQNSTFYEESQTILKALPVGIAIYDKNGQQEYINDAVAALFGVTDKKAHLSKHISIFEDPILTDEIKEIIRQGKEYETIVEYNLCKASEVDYFSTGFSHIMYIDGKIRYVKNDKGEIQKYILILNDITQNRTHELRLQRSEFNLKLALEAGSVNVWGYNILKHEFYHVQGKMLTYDGADIEKVCSILHEDYREDFVTIMNNLLSGEIREASFIIRNINNNGKDKYYRTGAYAVYSETGAMETIIGTHKDITNEYYYKQELRESLFKTRLAIKASNTGQWDYDCNTRMFSILEESASDYKTISTEEYLNIIHPEDRELITGAIHKMENRIDFKFSHNIRMQLSGHDNWQFMSLDGAPIKNSNGKIVKFTGFRRNNTKFILLNDKLKERNILLNMILHAGDIIPTLLDVRTGIIYISVPNNESKYIVHTDKDEIGIPLSEHIANVHPDDRDRITDMFDNLKNGTTKNGHEECRYYHNNGTEEKIYDFTYIGINYNKNGKPDKIAGYLQNISERKKIEVEIDRQKKLMNSILEKIPVPVYIKDIENNDKYIYWNEESRKTFGDEVFETGKFIFPDENQAKETRAIEQKILNTGTVDIREETIRNIEGLEFDTIVHRSTIHDSNKKYLLVVRWDISLKNELQRKTKFLSISMNTLKAFTWYCDLRDNILRFGDEFDKISENPSGMNSMAKFASRIHPDHRERFTTFINEFCKQESGDFAIEYLIDINNTGTYDWWECRGTMDVVTQGTSSYKYLYGMDINIDKHKKSELAILKNKIELDQLNKQNELILNNSNSGLVFLNNDYVVQWENLTSFLPGHPMTRNYKKGHICHKAVKGFEEPCPGCVVFKSQQTGKREIKEARLNDLTAELTATPIYDDNHSRIGTVLKVVDITESKKIYLELESAKNKAETANVLMTNIIDCLPCLLFIKDAANGFRHIVVNKYFCDVLGRPIEDIIGKTDYDLFPTTELADKCRRDDEIAISKKGPHIFEEETTFLGKRIIWQTTKMSFSTAEGHELIIAVSLDITNKIVAYNELQDAKEKAEQSNRLKSAFLANMSHEIRTPLNAIVGFSGLLAEATEEEEKKEYSGIINTNNELLLRLINDILDLSKIEAGMIELQSTPFDVAEHFKELSAMLETRITNPNVEFICENPYNSCIVNLDKNRFTQVITNFVTNAIKFTQNGHIRMGYRYINDELKIFVSDTGIGIAEDKIEKVFERFEKLDNFAQGTGLGMAICKAIVEAHHGKIGLDSEQGKGSTFWASYPVKAIIMN